MQRIGRSGFFDIALKCIFAAAVTFALNGYYFKNGAVLYFNSILNIVIFCAAYYFIAKAYEKADKRVRRYAWMASIPVALMLVFGHSFADYNDMREIFGSFAGFVRSAFYIMGFSLLFYSGFVHLFSYAVGQTEITFTAFVKKPSFFTDNAKSFFYCWGAIFVLWLPCYLAYYPGVFCYDVPWQTAQIFKILPLNNSHPIIHTLIWGLFVNIGIKTGSSEFGLFLYSIIQMLCMSAVFSYILRYLAKIKLNLYIRAGIFFYCAFYPLNAIFSFVPTKDVMSAGALALLFVELISLSLDPDAYLQSKKRRAAFVLAIFFFCITRHNAYPAFLLFFPVPFIVFKKYRKLLAVLLACVIVLNAVYNLFIFGALKIQPGSPVEAYCVPLQQLARTAIMHKQELSRSDLGMIEALFPVEDGSYNPRFSDIIKSKINGQLLLENRLDYLALWARLFVKYPSDYISAFLSNNLGYWYTDVIYPDPYSGRTYIETGIVGGGVGLFKIEKTDSKLPWLYEAYEKIAREDVAQKVPVVAPVFSIGFPFWMIYICLLLLCVKRSRLYIPLALLLTIWLTFMAGPVSNVRYLYPLFALLPVVAALAFYRPPAESDLREPAEISADKIKA